MLASNCFLWREFRILKKMSRNVTRAVCTTTAQLAWEIDVYILHVDYKLYTVNNITSRSHHIHLMHLPMQSIKYRVVLALYKITGLRHPTNVERKAHVRLFVFSRPSEYNIIPVYFSLINAITFFFYVRSTVISKYRTISEFSKSANILNFYMRLSISFTKTFSWLIFKNH